MKRFLIMLLLGSAPAVPALAQNSFGEAQQQQQPRQQQPQQQSPQQPQRPQTTVPPPAPAAVSQAPRSQRPDRLDALTVVERRDLGVAPTRELHDGAMHANTPASIPGGQLITTRGLLGLVQSKQAPYVLLDVLGGTESLPGAVPAAWASQPGSFNDAIQQQFGQMLQQVTRGNKQMPLVLYCASPQCWMSYNAALRAINLGYSNVLWYRGGVDAWRAAGQGFQATRQPMP